MRQTFILVFTGSTSSSRQGKLTIDKSGYFLSARYGSSTCGGPEGRGISVGQPKVITQAINQRRKPYVFQSGISFYFSRWRACQQWNLLRQQFRMLCSSAVIHARKSSVFQIFSSVCLQHKLSIYALHHQEKETMC